MRVNPAAAFRILSDAVNAKTVPAKSLDFVQSLLAAYVTPRGLSDKQEYWFVKIAGDLQEATAPRPAAVEVNAAPVFALLKTAQAAGLKWPKVRQNVDGAQFAIGLAGERSKYYGSATVTGPTPEGADRAAWYGVISPDGVYSPARNTPAAVVEAVAALAADPAGRAALHGRLTGACCFCGRRLDTRESVSVGYGPVCADKFGLPWGEVAGYAVAKDAAVAAAVEAAQAAVRPVVLVDESGMPLTGAALAAAQEVEDAQHGAPAAPQDDERRAAGYGVGPFDVNGDAAATGRFRFEALPGVRLDRGAAPDPARREWWVEPDEANADLPF